jgi:cytochrome c oxidase assembly protein subunit 15
MVAALVILLVVVGGFVRLSRAGLSIVEWDVITGIVPPIGNSAWEQSFAEYQQTPEYRLVNTGMDLAAYQRIFYIEWGHRLIARIAGLMVVLPLLWFLRKGLLSVRGSWRYWAIAALFGVQGAIGWVMVSSGLRDRPVVSHFRLTIHLLAALALLGIALWMALDRMGVGRPADRREGTRSRVSRPLAWALLATVVGQIAYGGLVAGLKAGYVSNTWPLMFGRIVPQGLLTRREPWWINLFEPLGAHWVHRWFAFVVVAIAIAVFVAARRDRAGGNMLRAVSGWLLGVIALQIALGVGVVVWGVPKWLALAHQGIGVALFCISLTITHQVQSRGSARVPAATAQSA